MTPLSKLESSTLLYKKWTDPAGRKPVRTELISTALSINWRGYIYILLHPTTAEYSFFSSSHRTFARQTIFWAIKQILTHLKE